MNSFSQQTDLFFGAFRTACWQMAEFSHQRAKTLHPVAFNCNRCDRSEKDTARGCPKCELITMLEHFKAQIVPMTMHYYGGWPSGWTLDEILKLHSEVATIVEGSGKKTKGCWNVRLSKLVKIYRSEHAQISCASNFERMKELESQSTQGSGGVSYTTISRRG